jgi:putative transposase
MEQSELPTVRKTYNYKLKPTPAQEQTLAFVLRRCRELYNAHASKSATKHGALRGVSITLASQSTQFPDIKEVRPDYREGHSQVLPDVLTRLDRAFQTFFRRVQHGETPGCPRFQGSNRFNSFTYKQFGNGATLENGFLVLAKIGRVAVRWSRSITGTPKTVTISCEADGWYVCCSCADVPVQPLPETGQETGIDLGIESFATLADGTLIHTPRCYRKAERRLKTAQRTVARRKKGSKRRKKAVQLLAEAHQKVGRQRQDLQHKTALYLVREYDRISHEDLQVATMVKTHHLAKSIADVGWSGFLTILYVKAVSAGRLVTAVHPAYTSQTCSGCGIVVTKGLSVRWHRCPDCGTSLHRDHNAAKNIERAGRALRGEVA